MSKPTRAPLPIILVRGFGGLDVAQERKDTYQRFNIGTVYPHKKGDNYIYEGMLLRFVKSKWRYQDAVNVIKYDDISDKGDTLKGYEPFIPYDQIKRSSYPGVLEKFERLKDEGFFCYDRVMLDPSMALYLLESSENPWQTLWVFRYYDLGNRDFNRYGRALVRTINIIRELTAKSQEDGTLIKPKVNIIAHSMGGLVVRNAVQNAYPELDQKAEDSINKIVTLGTPHRGINFQILENWISLRGAKSPEQELERFNRKRQKDPNNPEAFVNFNRYFPPDRLLAVVGTNYHTYKPFASTLNRIFSSAGEFGPNYNRSDGLVKQSSAHIPGAPRTFVHKCHGGEDSLISSRESYEIATRFFFGDVQVRLLFLEGKATLGMDVLAKSEFFIGVSIKPRGVDFELFHQSKEAENCYGPFRKNDPGDTQKNVNFSETMDEIAFPWIEVDERDRKLMWEGNLNTALIVEEAKNAAAEKDMVFRLEFYVSERDLLGLGFSDNVIFSKQYYVRALLNKNPLELELHTNQRKMSGGKPMEYDNGGWNFEIEGTGFRGKFRIELQKIPLEG